MADPTNDVARAQALLSQAGTTTCVGPKVPSHRRALRLKSLWTSVALVGLVAGVIHVVGGHATPASVADHLRSAPAIDAVASAQGAAERNLRSTDAPSTGASTSAFASHGLRSGPAWYEALLNRESRALASSSDKMFKTTSFGTPHVNAFGKFTPGPLSPPPPTSESPPTVSPAASAAPATAASTVATNVAKPADASNLITLPIPVTADDDELSLSRKLSNAGEFFPALALSLEKLRLTPYYDGVNNSNENIAIGYNITKRIGAHGRQYVHDELLAAGIATRDVDALLSAKRKIQKTAHITPESALRLLYVVAPEYEGIARDAVGPTFDKLPKNRQAAVTWLAYNTGDVSSFTQLVHGVQHDNLRQAMEHMTPWFRDTDGQVMVKNERAGAYLQGAYYSEAALKKVIQDPAAFEDRTLVHKESPIAAVDPAAAKALKKKGQLPIAPTVGPNTKPLPGAVVVPPPAPAPTLNASARWSPPVLTTRKLDEWHARQAPAPSADQDEINRAVSGPRGP